MMGNPVEFPEELEFLERFGVEPTEASPSDGFWRYEFSDDVGFKLVLSFNALERSLQTVLLHDDVEVARTSCEGMTLLAIDERDAAIRGRCAVHELETTVEIRIEPRLSVTWSSLKLEE